ncbi:MAG: hypothetical protein AB7U31_00800 [Synergistaceae bacterium]
MALDRGEDMDCKSKRIKFEDLGFSPEERLKLPSRRELSSRPWSGDQMRVFIERQKHVPAILAEMSIRIIRTVSYSQLKEEWDQADIGSVSLEE